MIPHFPVCSVAEILDYKQSVSSGCLKTKTSKTKTLRPQQLENEDPQHFHVEVQKKLNSEI